MSGKVVFVTPRYGTQIMGGAETAVRQLAEHLRAHDELGGRGPYDLRPRPPHLGRRAAAGDHRDQRGAGAPPSRRRTVAVPDFYGLDGLLRLDPPPGARGSRGGAGSTTTARSPPSWWTRSWRRMPTWSPSTRTCTTRPWRTIGKVKVPAVLHPAAHDEPALYLPVFRGTFGDADAFCFHTASERDARRADVPGGGAAADRARARRGRVGGHRAAPGGELLGLGDRPYVVSVGRVDEHKGSKMLASYFATYKERHPGPLALALVGPVSYELPPHPDIVVTGAGGRARQVGHRARRPRGGLAVGPRVVLPGGDRGVGRPGAGPGQRRLRADPGALRALGRRAVVHVVPRVRGGARSARVRRPAARRRSAATGARYVDRHFQWPVLVRALRRVPHRRWWSGGGARPGLF